jgi:hypothetical protein
VELINQYENEVRAIKDEAIRLSWHMRGGLTYDDAMLLSSEDKELIGKLVKDHMKTTKESGLPYF